VAVPTVKRGRGRGAKCPSSRAAKALPLEAKPARAAERTKKFGGTRNVNPSESLTFLEESQVAPVTAADYRRRLAHFQRWTADNVLPIDSPANLELAVLRYLEVLFFDGELVHEALRLMAALVFLRPDVQQGAKNLPRALGAVKGWRRLAPSASRLPLPWPVCCLMSTWMMRQGHVAEARRTVLMFAVYCRPSEALRLRVGDVVPPQPSLGGISGTRWSLVLNPIERGSSSKTGEYDESIVLDNDDYAFLSPLLRAMTTGRRADEQLLPGDYQTWAGVFGAAGVALRLQELGPPVLYQLRHGGASAELLSGQRDVSGIKKRGRWLSDTSLRRYEKGGRIAQQMARLPAAAQAAAAQAASQIGATLNGV